MTLPLRYHVAIALVGLNVLSTAALIGFAYRASSDSLETQATHAVGVAAHERGQALTRLLEQRQDRMRAFLGSVESLCGERNPSGSLAFDRECVRVALHGFQTAEHADAADLSYGSRLLARLGSWPDGTPAVAVGQLATLSGDPAVGYVMRAARGRLAVHMRVPLDDVDAIFRDRSGLDAGGDAFLTDHRGLPLTPARSTKANQSALGYAGLPCLVGITGQGRLNDDDGADMIAAFRPVSAFGGGCIVARLPHAQALVPIHQLGRRFVFGAIGFIMLGAMASILLARTATGAIRRLAATARVLEAGRFDDPVPIGGPREIRQLGSALSSMARSLGNLVKREHAARIQAESANRTKDDFLAMVSHELRTPLTAILGWASIAKRRRDDDALMSQALDTIERNADRQAHLIDELLDVSRITSGTLRLDAASEVSLTRVIDAALEGVQPLADSKGITISKRIDGAVDTVDGDADRLQQVMSNVLSNAVRFTPSGGRIALAIVAAAQATEIHVADSGIGIAREFLPHVFDRFQQADTGVTRTHGGLGLGMAIARHLVELHGGTIRAESAGLGCGATFVISLPRHAGAATATRDIAPGTRSIPPLLGGTHILVVDDDADTREVVRTILEDAGAEVVTTGSAAETRASLQRATPDVLIADIGMPKEDGYSLLRSVRALSPAEGCRVPAIALTAHARPVDVEAALASGFQMHLAKPVDSSRLLSAVTTTLLNAWGQQIPEQSHDVGANG
jgi:signal transduction histidine kinase/ActR/RegA family two-component response regulator